MNYTLVAEEPFDNIARVFIYKEDKEFSDFFTNVPDGQTFVNTDKIFAPFRSGGKEYALYIGLDNCINLMDLSTGGKCVGTAEKEKPPYYPYEIYVPKTDLLGTLDLSAKEIVGPNAHYAFVLYKAFGRLEKKIVMFDLSMVHRNALLRNDYFDPIIVELDSDELNHTSLKDIIHIDPFTKEDLKINHVEIKIKTQRKINVKAIKTEEINVILGPFRKKYKKENLNIEPLLTTDIYL